MRNHLENEKKKLRPSGKNQTIVNTLPCNLHLAFDVLVQARGSFPGDLRGWQHLSVVEDYRLALL